MAGVVGDGTARADVAMDTAGLVVVAAASSSRRPPPSPPSPVGGMTVPPANATATIGQPSMETRKPVGGTVMVLTMAGMLVASVLAAVMMVVPDVLVIVMMGSMMTAGGADAVTAVMTGMIRTVCAMVGLMTPRMMVTGGMPVTMSYAMTAATRWAATSTSSPRASWTIADKGTPLGAGATKEYERRCYLGNLAESAPEWP